MTFKKNWLSYFLWGSYAFFACIGLVGVLFCTLSRTPLNNIYAKIGITCLSFVLIAGLFTLIRQITGHISKRHDYILLEAFFAVIIVGIGILLRVYLMSSGREEAAYYEVAKVTGNAIQPVAHGVQYYYVLLLRGIFLITGNFFTSGIILQICLQCGASFLWFFVIRKYAGSLGSLIFLFLVMLLPASIKASITYSPKMLYLLLLGIVFSMIAGITESNQRNDIIRWYSWIKLIFIGFFIGTAVYLDITGVILIVPVVFIGLVKKNEQTNGCVRSKFTSLLQCLTILLSSLAFILTSFFIDSSMNQVPFHKVADVWATLFAYKGLVSIQSLKSIVLGLNNLEIWLAISVLILLGVPGFFVIKKTERQILWFAMSFITGVIWICNFHYSGMTCEQLLLFLICALAGVGIQNIWEKQDGVQENLSEQEVVQNQEPLAEQRCSTDRNTVIEQENRIKPEIVLEKASEQENSGQPVKQIHYIDNPLPLPKKHVKKALDYQKEVPKDKLNYDIEITDNDDFDI